MKRCAGRAFAEPEGRAPPARFSGGENNPSDRSRPTFRSTGHRAHAARRAAARTRRQRQPVANQVASVSRDGLSRRENGHGRAEQPTLALQSGGCSPLFAGVTSRDQAAAGKPHTRSSETSAARAMSRRRILAAVRCPASRCSASARSRSSSSGPSDWGRHSSTTSARSGRPRSLFVEGDEIASRCLHTRVGAAASFSTSIDRNFSCAGFFQGPAPCRYFL